MFSKNDSKQKENSLSTELGEIDMVHISAKMRLMVSMSPTHRKAGAILENPRDFTLLSISLPRIATQKYSQGRTAFGYKLGVSPGKMKRPSPSESWMVSSMV